MKPRNTKFRKYHAVPIKNYYNYKVNLIYSHYALIVKQPAIITDAQLQSIILTIKRMMKRKGKIILRAFPHQSITKKPQEVRMGKGKGNVHHWQQVLTPNSILFELVVPTPSLAKKILKTISHKLPFKTQFIQPNFY